MSRELTGVRADQARSYRSLEETASSVRKFLHIGPNQEFDASDFFEFSDFRMQHRGKTIRVITGVDSLPDLTEALTRYNPELRAIELLLSEESYQMLRGGNPRGKYTVSHELGHAVLHTDALIRLAELNVSSRAAFHRGKADHPAYFDTEWQANVFGGALRCRLSGFSILRVNLRRSFRLITWHITSGLHANQPSTGWKSIKVTRRSF